MKIQEQYSDKEVTAWGGMLEMKELIERSGIRNELERIGLPQGKSNNSIDAVSIVEAFWVSVWIGCYRFSHTTIVKVDETLRKIFGWKRVASGVTFGRFFKKFTWQESTRIFTELNKWFFNQLKFDNYALDVDSSVITRYGSQQGAHVGYNPRKPGRPSHHPIFAFVSDLRMVANCWLRSGDSSSSNNLLNFLEETFSILCNKKIGLFRADAGFCSEKIFAFLEAKQLAYVIAGRMHAMMQQKIKDIKIWNAIGEGIWITEVEYKGTKWSIARRIVLVKQSVLIRPKASGKKLKLFDDTLFYEQYRYHCFVTNQTLPAKQIWEQYKERADAENRIKELKEDFGAEGFAMDHFYATEASMRMIMIAYNLMSLFRQVTHQKQPQPKLSTLRFNCFAVGSWLVKEGNKLILKMAVPLKRRRWYEGLFSSIRSINLPISLQK